MICLNHISKKFKSIVLFDDINVEFESGKINYIKGVNGCGKSVLLKLIVGYSQIDSGDIYIDDYHLHFDGDFIPDAGVCINAPEFISYYTGYENLLALANLRKKISEKDIMKYVKMLGMEESIDKKYSSYSLGMKQKLRFIQAIMEESKYLILDEPFDALDKKSVIIVKQILKDYIKDKEKYIIITSHDDIEDLVDEVYEIDDHKVIKLS